ncbi:MAG: trypsin-like peptidase domain-containing protein, partial [Pseudonocardiaceae bacterium]
MGSRPRHRASVAELALMRRQVEAYGYWSDHPADRAEWTCGSGYLLGGRLVLTAAHVVCPGGRPVARVQVRDESGLVAARVAWHRWDDEVDIALLEMTEPGWVAPVWRHPVRWGQLVTTRAGQACEAIGFPKVVASPQRRDSHHATGVINPGSLVKAGLSAMEVDNPPVGPGPGGSWWAGMSGAALLCQQRVIGVVTTDPEGFDSRRLVTVPVATVIKDPEFRDLITRHVGRAPVLEPVELTGLAEPVQAADSPAGLLRAGVADTPFRDRPELDVLRRWCRSSPWSSIRLVAGPGGQGKTRLARQLANELGGQGWATVMLAERVPEVQIAVLAQVRVPTLIVVDYAEGRTHQLEAVLAAMGQAEAKVRLLLLARTAGAWRTERVDPSPLLEPLADERIVVQLGPLEPTPQGRQAAWRQAVTALAAGLSELDLTRDGDSIDWATHAAGLATPVLDGPGYRTILAVQIDALARLLQAGAPLTDPGNPPEQILLAHESRYWTRVATRFGVTLTPPTRQCLVATATLWGAANAEQAHDLLSAALPERRTEERSTIGEWLSALYRDGQRYWSGVQPDRLAEHLIGTTLTDPQRCPGVLTSAVNCARDEQLDHALTVLGRAVPQHPGLAEVIAETIQTAGGPGGLAALTVAPRLEHPQPMLEALQPLINSASIDTLQTLSSALPRHSMLLGPISLALTTTLVARLRDATIANRDAHLPALAGSVNNLAVDLAEVGRRGEALTAAQEAADLYRELVALNRDAHVPDLAMSVN